MGICGESSRKKNINEKPNNNSNNNKESNLVNNPKVLHSSTEIKGNQSINKKILFQSKYNILFFIFIILVFMI